MSEPAHKVSAPDRKPGQIVYPLTERYLSQYILRKQDEVPDFKIEDETWTFYNSLFHNWNINHD